MKITLAQKLKLLPVWGFLKSLLFIETIEEHSRRLMRCVLWVVLATFLILALLGGVFVKSATPFFYKHYFSSSVPVAKSIKIPQRIGSTSFVATTAKAVLVADTKSGAILMQKAKDVRLAPASTTKLMTALVALDLYSLDEYLFVPNFCTTVEGTKIGFFEGEKLKVEDLMYSLLVNSANDAACVLANSQVTGIVFVKLMNKKAVELGLSNTYFSNAVGLDGVNGGHYSSAYDLYLLAKHALKSDFIKKTVSTKEYELLSGKYPRKIYTTNYLLWAIPNSVGVKTGKTERAGEVLIYEYKSEEKDIMIIVMGSQDRFLDVRNILDWVLNNYSWDG